jgi:hypothetical protein
MRLVVIRELPRGKETLLLRMMGAELVRAEALRELRGMPEGDPDARAMRRVEALRDHLKRHRAWPG